MNSRLLPIIAVAVAAAACVLFFVGIPSPPFTAPMNSSAIPPGSSSGGAGADAAAADVSTLEKAPGESVKKPSVNWARLSALINSDGKSGEQIPKASDADLERFIAAHGESAVNLVAAYEHSRDRRWIDRALELFPDSPLALMTAIHSLPDRLTVNGEVTQPTKERLEFIERFKAADPNNPVPWLFAAQEFFRAKQTVGGIAEIRAAIERPAFYTYNNERADAARQIYEDLGLGSLEAGVLASAGVTLPHMSAAQQSSRSLMEVEKNAIESGDTAAAEDAIHLTYSLGRMFATPEASSLLIGQLVSVSMERRALEALPADAQPDYLPVKPAERIAELDRQKQAVKDLVAASKWLYESNDEKLFAEYYRRLRSDGEFAALTWLKTQKKPPATR